MPSSISARPWQETEPTLQPAIAAYEKAISLQPDLATAHWNLGFALLLSGDYPRGLPEYEWRIENQEHRPAASFPRPRVGRRRSHGKRILLHAEQGLGDTIHMARFIPMVGQRGAALSSWNALPRSSAFCAISPD